MRNFFAIWSAANHKLRFSGIKNLMFLLVISVLCTIFLWISTIPENFNTYGNALPVAFALSCASILIGLMMSINMVCNDYEIIRRELRSGISAIKLICTKTLVILILSGGMSLILISPYIFDAYEIEGQNTAFLYFAVFFTMVISAETGLCISTVSRRNPQRASQFITFIMLYQILFSGFIYKDNVLDSKIFRYMSISHYSIRAIGGALRFDHEHITWETPYNFENTFEYAFTFLGGLLTFFVSAMLVSILILYLVDKKGWD